jgi:putative flippase GtrA
MRVKEQFVKYLINGTAATLVHYAILYLNIELFKFSSAGLSNFYAAIAGISVSFFGSRYFVFPKTQVNTHVLFIKFFTLYATISILNGLSLLLWTDRLGFDYRNGFLIMTIFQITLSYMGNKYFVFKK